MIRKIRKLRRAVMLAGVVALAGCSDSTGPGSPLLGYWRLTQDVFFTTTPTTTGVIDAWLELTETSSGVPYNAYFDQCMTGPSNFHRSDVFYWWEEGVGLRFREWIGVPTTNPFSSTISTATLAGEVLTLNWTGAQEGNSSATFTFVLQKTDDEPANVDNACAG